jgi:hypothetical protein
MEKLKSIPIDLDLEDIKRRLHMEKREEWGQVKTLIEESQPIISGMAVYNVCYIQEKIEDAIVIEGIPLKSRVLRKNLDAVERVFPYVVTIGNRLEEKGRDDNDLLKSYYLDTIGNVALTSVRKYLKTHLQCRFALDGMSYMSPGSLKDWAIEEQKSLFSLLGDVEGLIGVSLSENFVMTPNKSVSGIYFPTEIQFYSCQLCNREGCPTRKAPYDKQLAGEYGVLE